MEQARRSGLGSPGRQIRFLKGVLTFPPWPKLPPFFAFRGAPRWQATFPPTGTLAGKQGGSLGGA